MNDTFFDENNMGRIKALMKIKGHALACDMGITNTFFYHFSNVVDVPLSYLMNDELSNFLNRGPIEELLEECRACEDDEVTASVDDMKDLFVNRADFLIGSLLLDFDVNAFSTFEKWMCSAYDFIKAQYPSSDSRRKKLIKYIEKYVAVKDNEDAKNDLLLKIMNKCSSYISSMDKIKYVIKKIDEKCDDYKSREQDIELIEFLSRVRNTVHTGGYNLTENSYSIIYSGEEYTLNSGEAFISNDHSKSILLWNRIIEIYKHVYIFIYKNFPQENHDGTLYHT